MSESLALFGKYMNMTFLNLYFYIRYSATYRPICTKFGTECLDDLSSNLLKFDVESIYFDRNMKLYVFF